MRVGSASRLGAITSLALAAELQAVDGNTLKAMVKAWAAAPELQRDGNFHAVLAIRQLEIGLASMFTLSMGFTATIIGIALMAAHAAYRKATTLSDSATGSYVINY